MTKNMHFRQLMFLKLATRCIALSFTPAGRKGIATSVHLKPEPDIEAGYPVGS